MPSVLDGIVSLEQIRDAVAAGDGHDKKLNEIRYMAETVIVSYLMPHIEDMPVPRDSHLWTLSSLACMRYAMTLWYEYRNLLDKAKHSDTLFGRHLKALIAAAKTKKPERGKALLITGSDPLSRTHLTSEIDQYLAREFY